MTAKEVVQEMLTQLPDDCTLEEIEYQLYVRRKVDESRECDARGEWRSHDEVKQLIDQWLSK